MNTKIKIILICLLLILGGAFLYDYANRGKSCGGGDDFAPPTAEEKHYHDSVVNAQSPIVQQIKDSIQRERNKEMDEKISDRNKLENPFVGKWQGVEDEIWDNTAIPKFEAKKAEFKRQNPFLSENELNDKTNSEIEHWKIHVENETKRANNYFIEFKKVTNHGEGNSFTFTNKNNNTTVKGEWTIVEINGVSTIWLLDNATNKTFEHTLERDDNGNYIMRMPVYKKGQQNTIMKKI